MPPQAQKTRRTSAPSRPAKQRRSTNPNPAPQLPSNGSSMSSFLSQVFCGCWRQSSSPNLVDETTRLIPDTAEPPPPQPSVVLIDHHKMNERLGSIVRVKEGKMVNVGAQVPFNLHNQPISNIAYQSSSRSTSRTDLDHFPQPGIPPRNLRYDSGGIDHPPSLLSAPDTPNAEAGLSHSPVNEEGGSDMEVYTRSRILNVRLVRGATISPEQTRRGRARGRAEAGASDETAVEVSGDADAIAAEGGEPNTRGKEIPRVEASPEAVENSQSSNTSTPAFTLKDTGALSLSWGD